MQRSSVAVSADTSVKSPVLPFSKLNKIFFGYLDPEKIFLDNGNQQFSGNLADISAKKEALQITLKINYLKYEKE